MSTTTSSVAARDERLVKFNRFAWATLATLLIVIFTGAGVRLSGSGLGCSNWPKCTETSLVPAADIHGIIEYANRLFSFVIGAACIGTIVMAHKLDPRQPGFVSKSWWIFFFVMANAVLGGMTVLFDLTPSMVMGHYLLTLIPIAISVVLIVESQQLIDSAPDAPVADPLVRKLLWATAGCTALVVFLGTVVTAAGPHAGDETAERLDVSLQWAARVHAGAVWVLVGLLLTTWYVIDARLDEGEELEGPARAVKWLAIASAAQGSLGYVQYLTGTPAWLAAIHVAGSGIIFTIAVRIAMHAHNKPSVSAEVAEPVGAL